MENIQENRYVKRTRKEYSMSLKLQIVQEIEQEKFKITQIRKQYGIQSHGTVLCWLGKFGNFDWDKQTPLNMPKSIEKK